VSTSAAYLKTLLESVIEKYGLDIELESVSNVESEVVMVLQSLMLREMSG
jgi:hypothetical protein